MNIVAPAPVKRYAKGTDSDVTDAMVVSTLQGGGGDRGYRIDAEGAAGGHVIADTIRSHPRPGSNSSGNIVAHTLTREGFDASEDGTGRGTPLTTVRASGHGGSNGMGVYEHGDAPTLDTTGNAGFADAAAIRRLTPVECERLQAFPDGWTLPDGPSLVDALAFPLRVVEDCPPPDGPRYAAMGNAVTVTVIEWIGRRLTAHVQSERLEEAA